MDGAFAPWVGALIKDISQKIIFIGEDESRINEIALRFSRVGYDNTLGYLLGGIKAWKDHGFNIDYIDFISAEEFAKRTKNGSIEIALDVRNESEYISEHVEGLENFPLDFIHSNFHEIDPEKEHILHCQGGYRSLIAASIFKANGVKNVIDVTGGFNSIKKTNISITDYVCPTTLL